MPFLPLPHLLHRTRSGIPSDAVGVFELTGQSNAGGTNGPETDQSANTQALWQDVENYARIWSRCRSDFQYDPDTLNLGTPTPPETQVDQWRPMTTGYGLQGAKPWNAANPNIGPERVIAYYLHAFFGIPIYCIKCSQGGTSILDKGPDERDFNPKSAPKNDPAVRMWDVWVRYRTDALPALRAEVGPKVPIYHLGHVFVHGTKDARPNDAPAYSAALQAQIDGWRALTPGVPIAITRLQNYQIEDGSYFSNLSGTPDVRRAQMDLAEATADAGWSDTDSGQRNADIDQIHFSGDGLVNVGTGAAYTLTSIDKPVLLPI